MPAAPSTISRRVFGVIASRLPRVAQLAAAALLIATVARVGGWTGMVALAYAGLTSVAPAAALLMLAAFLPLGSVLTGVFALEVSAAEVQVLSFLGGIALRCAVRSRPRPDRVLYPALLLMLVGAASYGVRLWELRARLGATVFADNLRLLFVGEYLNRSVQFEGLAAAITFVAGVGLFIATRTVVAGEPGTIPRLARMFSAGAAGAAAMNLARLLEISFRAGGADALLRIARAHRINVHYADINAAGSYFGLMIFLPLSLAASARSGARVIWLLLAFVILAALWLTASRGALLSILAAGAVAAVARVRRPAGSTNRAVAGPLLAITALALAVVMFLPNRVIGPGTRVALEVRRDMAIVAVQLLRSAPLFGIGVGEFYAASAEPLRSLPTGRYYFNENAHNNFLQILAELGLVGMGLVVWLGIETIRGLRGSAEDGEHTVLASGFTAGVTAFLLSAVLGHPLLTADVAFAFWAMLGALAGLASTPRPPSRGVRRASFALAVFVLASLPFRSAAALREAELDHVGYGLSGWRVDADGTRFRTSDGAATIFVPTAATRIDVPLRVSGTTAEAVVVEVALDGRTVDRIHVTSQWRPYRLRVPAGLEKRFVPVTFHLPAGALRLDVGKVSVLQQGDTQ